jgi:hypothetical protein
VSETVQARNRLSGSRIPQFPAILWLSAPRERLVRRGAGLTTSRTAGGAPLSSEYE